ncbi:hypothetical protein [Robertmurraya sp.]|uniref:hypothetical protein n=1 Tax=Robertmurraya sp. TaxID=2837525 RepID=UPI00370402E6
MIESIVEVWCSPLRQEDYSIKIIPLCAGDLFNVEDDIREYVSWTGNFFYNSFGDSHSEVKGLWKVVFKIGVGYVDYYDWEGCPDTDIDFFYTELFKGQCESWTEVKYTWLELSGKAGDYFGKPWKKHLGFDYENPSS